MVGEGDGGKEGGQEASVGGNYPLEGSQRWLIVVQFHQTLLEAPSYLSIHSLRGDCRTFQLPSPENASCSLPLRSP